MTSRIGRRPHPRRPSFCASCPDDARALAESPRWRVALGAGAFALGALGALGCSGSAHAESETEAATAESEAIPDVPVPPANGPKLLVLRHLTVVRDRPSAAGKALGYLRAGAQIARAAEPYGKNGCEGGWYPVRPRGFVCAGSDATIDLSAPLATLPLAAPRLESPMPYRYVRVKKGEGVVYAALPSPAEQLAAEPKLGGREAAQPKPLGAGANDVPVDELGIAKGPPVIVPGIDGAGEDGLRTTLSFFELPGWPAKGAALADGAALAPSGAFGATQVVKRLSGMPIAGVVTAGSGKDERRFGVLPDGRFLPLDRVAPALGSGWHGSDLREIGLPLAFAVRSGVRDWKLLPSAKVEVGDDELDALEAIPLTGRFRTVNESKYYYTRDDRWVRARDLIIIPKRDKFPDFATPTQKWIDVSLANQTLVVWEGRKPLYATLVSSGQDRVGDPEKGPATVQGVFKVRAKYVTRDVDEREVGQAHSLLDAPWVTEFAEGFGFVGSYWNGDFGEAAGFHAIALPPVDARFIWTWSDPAVPEGWHGVAIDDAAATTIVYTHR
ncbi:MAG: L,D-transpeptidase [Polyangiaceae bacterium]|nr:L,D-transpeptidase [Polyangiaceae bacterium]